MLEGFRSRVKERRQTVRTRETKFLMSFDAAKLNKRLVILLSIFIMLNCLDALTTLVAISTGRIVELNPIASSLFHMSFPGFMAALVLKYMPIIPLAYATHAKENAPRPLAIRIVKVSVFVALVAANIFYLAVVGSNLRTLASYYLVMG
ncbi:MAG: DUF5658 family protein [Nitrososphaerales archaeon]|jgi:hypothetical protein